MASRARPLFDHAVRQLLEHARSVEPAFAHIEPERVLVVAGEARRASRATIKPLFFTGGRRVDSLGRRKPLIVCHGVVMRYIITLRPLFFRRSTARARVATVLHELFHISRAFDGTLDHRRRHEQAGSSFESAFRPIERSCFKSLPPELVAAFAYDGEVRVSMWLERPSSWLSGMKVSRKRYSERQLFEGIVRMKTKGDG